MNTIIFDSSNYNFCNYCDQLNFNNKFLGINELLIFYLNIRSFNSNFDELSQYLNGLKLQPAVLVLTETWFSECTITEIDGCVSYHTYRKDSRGGGGCLFTLGIHSVQNALQISWLRVLIWRCVLSQLISCQNYVMTYWDFIDPLRVTWVYLIAIYWVIFWRNIHLQLLLYCAEISISLWAKV